MVKTMHHGNMKDAYVEKEHKEREQKAREKFLTDYRLLHPISTY